MDQFVSFLKKHKKRLIILLIILIVILVIFWSFKKIYNYLSPSTKQSVYGDRCDNVKKYPVKDDTKKAIEDLMAGHEGITLSKIDVKCKLIDIVINFDTDKPDDFVVGLGTQLLSVIPEDIKNNYDIELFITSSNKEDETYPRIGTHHKVIKGEANDNFVW